MDSVLLPKKGQCITVWIIRDDVIRACTAPLLHCPQTKTGVEFIVSITLLLTYNVLVACALTSL
jgi:hypothetical protein